MKNKIIEIVAEELIGSLPLHKGPFVSNAEARRCANFDNQKRFDLAEAIATRIMEQLGGCYVECELKDVLIGQPILEAKQGVRTSDKYATFPNDYEGDRVYLKKLPPHPKEETDWNKLREQYFEECTSTYADIMKRVSMAPHDLFEWFKKRLSNPLKEEPKDNGWISVEDRLPELHESVIISKPSDFPDKVYVGWLSEKVRWFEEDGPDGIANVEVCHWMPLPNPPKCYTDKQ